MFVLLSGLRRALFKKKKRTRRSRIGGELFGVGKGVGKGVEEGLDRPRTSTKTFRFMAAARGVVFTAEASVRSTVSTSGSLFTAFAGDLILAAGGSSFGLASPPPPVAADFLGPPPKKLRMSAGILRDRCACAGWVRDVECVCICGGGG